MLGNYLKKINELENKINNLFIKIGELEEKLKYLQNRKDNKIDNKPKDDNINKMNDELEKIKKALEELKNAHDQTVIKVNDNREQIDLILGRLNDIINGYKTGDETLQKEIDELNKKLTQINSQLDLLFKLPKSASSGNTDLSALNELMKKIIALENDFKLLV